MTTAAESIVLNIVEGCGARSAKDFARFLDHGIKSSSELESQLELARDYEVLPASAYHTLAAEVVEIRRMTCVFRSKVLRGRKPAPDPE